MPAARQLQIVPPHASRPARPESQLGDLGLTAMIFVLGVLPLACEVGGLGRWGAGSLGLGTAGAMLSGRELLAWLVGGRTGGAEHR